MSNPRVAGLFVLPGYEHPRAMAALPDARNAADP